MQHLATNELLKEPNEMDYHKKLVKADWLGKVGSILQKAYQIYQSISSHTSNVLVYCKNGTQMTPLLVSLA